MNPRREKGALEARIQNQLQHEFVLRRAGQLACGDVVKEPVLGLARISTVVRKPAPFVRITWTDDEGPSTAAGRYHADQPFAVRVPGAMDILRIQRGLDRAVWLNQSISRDTARLIAAHLHRGPTSSLFGFVVGGRITDRFFEELDEIQDDQRFPGVWVQALARYVVSREDLGRVPRRRPTDSGRGPHRHGAQTAAAPTNASESGRPGRRPLVLVRKQIGTDHALQLIDAAYALGFTAGRLEGAAEAVRRPAWARYVAGVRR